jgi:hypothetical protein
VSSITQDAVAAQKEVDAILGREAQPLSVAQTSGARAAMEAEFGLAAHKTAGATIEQAQRARSADAAQALDIMVDTVAANPAALADEAVGKTFADASAKLVEGWKKQRMADAGPLYKQVEEATGNLFPRGPVTTAAESLIQQRGRTGGVTGQLKKTIKFLESSADDAGFVPMAALNRERQFWSGVAGGEEVLSRKLSPGANRRIGAEMLGAFDKSMAAGGQGRQLAQDAADSLRKANEVWASYSKQISDFTEIGSGKGLVAKMLGLGDAASGEQIVAEIRRLPGDRLRGLLKTLEKTPFGKSAAQDVRARLMLDVFEAGGHARAGKAFPEERLSVMVTPKKMADAISKNEGLFQNLFHDQPSVMGRLRALRVYIDRLATGPQARGPQAAPDWVSAKTISEISKRGALERVTGLGVESAKKAALGMANVLRLGMSPQQAAELMSTRDGVRAFFELVNSESNPFRARAAARSARALVHMWTILNREGLLEAENE